MSTFYPLGNALLTCGKCPSATEKITTQSPHGLFLGHIARMRLAGKVGLVLLNSLRRIVDVEDIAAEFVGAVHRALGIFLINRRD